MTTYEVSTTQDWTRQLQSSEEFVKGVTQLNDTWKNIGISTKITEGIAMTHEEIPLLGTADRYDDALLEQHETVTINWMLIDTRFTRYCTEVPNGAGTIERTNSVLRSQKIDNVANTKIYKGLMCDRATVNLDKLPSVNATFKIMSSTDWLTQLQTDTAIGGTTVYAPALTTTPWTHLTSGTSNPFVYGAGNRDIEKGTIDITRNALEVMALGNKITRTMRSGFRRIAFNFDTWVKDSALIGDVKNMTARTISMALYTTPITITLANCKFNSYATDSDAGTGDIYKETLVGSAQTVTISPLTVPS
jgi:hypothetical protein